MQTYCLMISFFCSIHDLHSVRCLHKLQIRASPCSDLVYFRTGQIVEAHPQKSRRIIQEDVGWFSEDLQQEQFCSKMVGVKIKTVSSCL